MATIDIGDAKFHYEERDGEEPVVLVHGSVSDHRAWSEHFDKFEPRYRLVAYSRRYHWPNEPIEEGVDYSMLEHVEDLQKVIERLDMGPVHLVGHSYGGFVALLLAMRAPHLVRSLVLLEPPVLTLFVSNEPRPSELLRLLVTRPRTALAIIKFGATGLGPATKAIERGEHDKALDLFGKAVLGPEFYDAIPDDRREHVKANLIDAEFLGSGFPPLDPDEIRKVDKPVLLVNGERSPKVFHHFVDGLEELLPNAQRVVIPNASHDIQDNNPDGFIAALHSFLEKTATRPSPVEEDLVTASAAHA